MYLWEDILLSDTNSVVAASVQTAPGQATEVSDTGQSCVNQPIQEVIHPGTAKCNRSSDWVTFPELETRNGFPR